jgi:hypothetical protein
MLQYFVNNHSVIEKHPCVGLKDKRQYLILTENQYVLLGLGLKCDSVFQYGTLSISMDTIHFQEASKKTI